MPIEVSCPSCAGHFRVPDSAAGKKIRCPKCKGAMDVPAAELPPAAVLPSAPALPPAPAVPAAPVLPPMPALPTAAPQPKPPPDEWFLQTADGEEYGPVSRAELDGWLAEGRVTVDCQLLRGGQQQWQWAADVYPELDSGAQTHAAESREPARRAVGVSPLRSEQPTGKTPKRGKKAQEVQIPEMEGRSQRSRLVAGFLGIFLGPLGIHRFYLGYWGLGLAMLCTAGGLGLWSLIDAIFVMTGRVSDADGRPLSD